MKKINFLIVSSLVGTTCFVATSNCTYMQHYIGSSSLEVPTDEIDLLDKFFNGTIDFSKVNFRYAREGDFDNRSLTIANTVFISADRDCESNWSSCRGILTHELLHVWQHQKFGLSYIKNNRTEIYYYNLYEGEFTSYGIEQQAQMVQDYYGWIFEDKPRISFCMDCLDYEQDEVIIEIERKLNNAGILP